MKFETTNRSWWGQVTRTVRSFPVDLLGVVGIIVLLNAVFRIPGLADASIAGAQIQPLVGIPALVLVPGYVLVAILFPGASDSDDAFRLGEDLQDIRSIDSIDTVERAALAFGMSLAVIPIYALVVGTVWNFSAPVVIDAFTVLVLGGVLIASVLRFRLPREDRYGTSVSRWIADLRTGLFRSDSGTERIVNLVLVLAIFAAVGAVGYAVATPYQSSGSSMLYLATENETGVQTASEYPSNLTAGQEQTLMVGIRNDEDKRQPYTVVVALERVETNGNSTTVVESTELDRIHATVADDETVTRQHGFAPPLTGEDLRLHYYLYKGESAPSDPGPESAYRDVYIWIDVTAA